MSGKVVPLARRQKDEKIYHLRRAGLDFQQISRQVKVPLDECMARFRDYQKALAANISLQEREVHAQLDLDRLDQLLQGFYDDAVAGDNKALDSVIKIMAHRMKLLGLDQANPVNPGQVANIIMVGGSQEEFLEALKQGQQQPQMVAGDTLDQ